MKIDYSVLELNNSAGDLSAHYPSNILIPENENQPNSNGFSSQLPASRQETIYESTLIHDASKLREIITKARFAR